MKRRLGEQPIEADVRWLRVLLGRVGLAQPGGWLPFALYGAIANTITATVSVYSCTLSRPVLLRYWYQTYYVSSPNDASNYWTINMIRLSDATTIASFTTIAGGVATWTTDSQTGLGLSLTASHLAVYIRAVRTGSAGQLALMAPAVFAT